MVVHVLEQPPHRRHHSRKLVAVDGTVWVGFPGTAELLGSITS